MISKVCTNSNENPNPYGFGFLLCADRFEKLNAVRMSAAREGSTERLHKFSFQGKENCKQIWPVPVPTTNIKSVHEQQKEKHTVWCAFSFWKIRIDRFEPLNATPQWGLACEGLTGRHHLFFSEKRKMQTNPADTCFNNRHPDWCYILKSILAKMKGLLYN